MRLLPIVLLSGGLLPLTGASSSPNDDVQDAFDGVLRPDRTVHLGSAAEGLLSNVHVERGDFVAAGALVAELDRSVERANLRLAEARRDDHAALETARTRRDEARRRLDRVRQLHADGIATAEELESAATTLQLEELAIERALEDEEVTRLECARAAALVELGRIESPIDGFVVERYLSPGELLTRSGQDRVATLVDLDPLRVELHLPSSMFTRIAVGDRAEVRPENVDVAPREAHVVDYDRVVDTASDTFRVRLELPNRDHALPAGLRCAVRFVD